jgi:hypothetical protein
VTLTGTGFVPKTTVWFFGSSITTVYSSATQVIAIVPAGMLVAPTSGTVTAVNPSPGGGSSNALTFTVSGNPMPSITSIAPTSTPTGSPDTQVTIAGNGFVSASVVQANGVAVSSNLVSSKELQAIVPTGDLAQAGAVSITVQNPAPGGGTSNAASFIVGGNANGSPIVTAVSPASAHAASGGSPGSITLSGSGFVPGGYVVFGGQAIGTTYVSSTQVTGAVHPALLQTVGVVSVTYANAADAGAGYLGDLGNAGSFSVTDPGDGGCGGSCGSATPWSAATTRAASRPE